MARGMGFAGYRVSVWEDGIRYGYHGGDVCTRR